MPASAILSAEEPEGAVEYIRYQVSYYSTNLIAEDDGKLVVHLRLEALLGQAGVMPVHK